jgi:hypothetical protein
MRNIPLLGIAGASTVAMATWMAATMLIVLPRRNTCIRAADGFALRTMPRKSRWRRQAQGIRPKVTCKRQQVTRQMRSQSG